MSARARAVPRQIVMWSGGAASFNAAVRTCAKYGRENVTLLFTDVGQEDETTYQAVQDAPGCLGGVDLEWICEGRSVWELFFDEGIMGKPGAGLCSRILKRETARRWVDHHYPETTSAQIVIGLTWEEMHRLEGARRQWEPYAVWFPMTEEPWFTKRQMIDRMRVYGVTVPELYSVGGFEHANCGGACIKQGHAGWRRLLEVYPDRFGQIEQNEQAFRFLTGKDVSILRDRRGGPVKPYTLRQLREDVQAGRQVSMFEGGAGCGCFSDEEDS